MSSSSNDCISIKEGKLISESKFNELVDNYQKHKRGDELNFETFSIGVLDLLKHPDGKFFRIHIGRKEDLNCLILVSLDENGKVLSKVVDEDKFDVERHEFSMKKGEEDLLMLEWGSPCPKKCKPVTSF